MKDCMAGHLFVARQVKIYNIIQEFLCDCEDCFCLSFLSCVNNISKFIENKNNDNDDSEDCLLDEKNNPSKIFEFVTILSIVAVISCNSPDPIYFIRIVARKMWLKKAGETN